jgi:FMN phosphatase YigB (HAD superfamily)
MIKGIICDLDGAYFISGKEKFIQNVSLKYKVNEEDVQYMFLSSESMSEYKRGKIEDKVYWEEFIQKLRIQTNREELLELLVSGYEQDEKIVDLIKTLHQNGYMTFICSNNFRDRIRKLDQKFSFLKNFSQTVFSCDYGKLKLEGFTLFDTLVQKSGLKPQEIFMFDNGTENVAHAKAYGFFPVWYRTYLELVEEMEKAGIKI